MVAKELSDLEKQFPAELMLFVFLPLKLLICEGMGINACKVDMEIMTIMFADKVYAAYKTNCVFQCYSGPPGRLFNRSFWRAGDTREVSIKFYGE